MKKIANTIFLLLLFAAHTIAGNGTTYKYAVDLNNVSGNKLTVELVPPAITQSEVIYRIPKIVPGTYEIYDFGRFISNFKATDEKGQELQLEQPDVNSWKIKNASHLAKIVYQVEGSWSSILGKPIVFEPAGTNIEEGRNFVLNNHGFFGYFDGMKKIPFELSITRPAGFYGSTSLMDIKTTGNTDVYTIADYVKLADAPIMYCKPDTTTVTVGGARVLISAYSPNHTVTSTYIAETISQILSAQKDYLGGTLPIEKYAFIFYFCEKPTLSGNSGALEHNLSSFYVLPEVKQELLKQTLRDVASHEFFHIVTPLSIHSEQIADFDFAVPNMSEHLWLYEGMTEYSAGLVQVKYGIIDLPTYSGMIHDKLVAASKYNNKMPFTVMSKHVVETGYHDQYGNVYQKGALIGMCLDLKLRKLSGGKYGIQEMLRDLAKQYGRDKAFKDEELFPAITKITYPEIGEFFKHYVAGSDPLPIREVLGSAGIDYAEVEKAKGFTLGGFELGYDEQGKHFIVAGTKEMDIFGQKMNFKEGDQLLLFNGTTLSLENVQEVVVGFLRSAKTGDQLKVEVLRTNKRGKVKHKKLHAKMMEVEIIRKDVINVLDSSVMSPEQKSLRKAWINQ